MSASMAAEQYEQRWPDAVRVVVDDHEVVRAGINAILAGEPDFEVVGESGPDDDPVAVIAMTQPDVVLLNPGLRARRGPDLCAQLIREHPGLRILVMSTHAEIDLVRECIAAGAHGYVIKDIGRTELIQAVRAVHRGDVAVSPAVAARIIDQMRPLVRVRTNSRDWHSVSAPFATPAPDGRPAPLPALLRLSSRERDVLARLLEGERVHAIAEALFVSESTVRNHLSSIFRKVGVHSQAELIHRLLST